MRGGYPRINVRKVRILFKRELRKSDTDIDSKAGWLIKETINVPYRLPSQGMGITHSDVSCSRITSYYSYSLARRLPVS